MPDVLLTDIDGTLVDSNALHAEAWRRTFEHFGIQVGLDETWRQIGKGGDQVIPVFVPEADRGRLEEPLKQFRKQIFHRDYLSRMVAFSKARELLLRVRESGMKIALATSSDKADLAHYGELVGIDDLVDEASSSNDAKASKPDADIFVAALQKVNMEAKQAVALGDTPWDAQARHPGHRPHLRWMEGGRSARRGLRRSLAGPSRPATALRRVCVAPLTASLQAKGSR